MQTKYVKNYKKIIKHGVKYYENLNMHKKTTNNC